jgi:hypothetical protein
VTEEEFDELKIMVRTLGQELAQLRQATQTALAAKWDSRDGMEVFMNLDIRHQEAIAAVRAEIATPGPAS